MINGQTEVCVTTKTLANIPLSEPYNSTTEQALIIR
jgi:hypothetical protein